MTMLDTIQTYLEEHHIPFTQTEALVVCPYSRYTSRQAGSRYNFHYSPNAFIQTHDAAQA
jgi:hypothetical protein